MMCIRVHIMPGRPFSHFLYSIMYLLFFFFFFTRTLLCSSLVHFQIKHVFFFRMTLVVIHHGVGNTGQRGGIRLH